MPASRPVRLVTLTLLAAVTAAAGKPPAGHPPAGRAGPGRPAGGQPSTRPLSPKAQLLAWAEADATRSAAEVLPDLRAMTPPERAYAKALAGQTVAAAKLQRAVRDKWGPAGEAAVLHAVGQDTLADDAAATEQVRGDRATVTFDHDDIDPVELVRVDGLWKEDIRAYLAADADDPDGAEAQYAAVADLFRTAAADLAAGRYKSAAEMAAKLKVAFDDLDDDDA